jgi:hypothetical protein
VAGLGLRHCLGVPIHALPVTGNELPVTPPAGYENDVTVTAVQEWCTLQAYWLTRIDVLRTG